MSEHARFSPSGAHRWMVCPGSLVLEAEYPDDSSAYADEGTTAHELAAGHLREGWDLSTFIGDEWALANPDGSIRRKVRITEDMVEHVMGYAAYVRELAGGAPLLVEQRVRFDHVVGHDNQFGTADAIIIKPGELIVVDLKYGMGVEVLAEENPQLQLYALGALKQYEALYDFEKVTVAVYQPRRNHYDSWSTTVEALGQFAGEVGRGAANARDALADGADAEHFAREYLQPGEKQCRFCRAKAGCPALAAEVAEIVTGSATAADFAEFVPVEVDASTGGNYLSAAMAKVGLVEDWCKAIRAETERLLLAGKPVDGFKLVQGRRGPRRWVGEAEAEALLKKSFRLKDDEVYERSVISPTKAEKLLKNNPKRWAKVEKIIIQSEGKPSVAPATDPRPALDVVNVADEFRAIAAE